MMYWEPKKIIKQISLKETSDRLNKAGYSLDDPETKKKEEGIEEVLQRSYKELKYMWTWMVCLQTFWCLENL